MDAISEEQGTTIVLPKCKYTLEGYTFAGWSTIFDATEATYTDCGNYTVGNSDVTLYAVWVKDDVNTYTITFNETEFDVKGIMDAISEEQGTTIVLPKCKYTLEGYTFVGWTTTFGATEATYSDCGNYTVGNSDVTLYAVWVEGNVNTYTITFNKNNDEAVGTMDVFTGKENTQIKLPNCEYTLEGYTFAGWTTTFGATVSIYNNMGDYIIGESDSILYAVWEISKYTITYDLSEGTNSNLNPTEYTNETSTIELQNPTKKGYKFIGWYNKNNSITSVTQIEQGSSGDIFLYAKWEPITYSINYVLDEGINNNLNPTEYTIESPVIILQDPTKSGYTFKGWYSDSNKSIPITSINQGSIGNISIYAVWIENSLAITVTLTSSNDPDIGLTYQPDSIMDSDIDFMTNGRFSSYAWYFEGELISDADEEYYTVDTRVLTPGNYMIMVLVDEKYSATAVLKVQKTIN